MKKAAFDEKPTARLLIPPPHLARGTAYTYNMVKML